MFQKLKNILCKLGMHNWKTLGISVMPTGHIRRCSNCGIGEQGTVLGFNYYTNKISKKDLDRFIKEHGIKDA